MIEGVSHITFMVGDLERTVKLWRDGLGAEIVFDSRLKPQGLDDTVFLKLGGMWIALIVTQDETKPKAYDHVAFKVKEEDLDVYGERLEALDVAVEKGRVRKPGEGRSLYFRDFDGHLLELHSGTLEKRLRTFDA